MTNEQLALPLGVHESWRSRIRRSTARSIEFVLRWVLRIALPVAGAAAMLRLFPYKGTAAGVHFQVEGSLFLRPGISADTSFGDWEFPHVTALPLGAHISPTDVDVVRLAAGANQDRASFVDSLRADVQDQVPRILAWLAVDIVVGVLLGLAVATAISLAVRYIRHLPARPHELRRRVRALGATALVLVVTATVGIVTYDSNWAEDSRTTGTLATLQLFPDQLSQYYDQRSKFTDVLGGIASIQSQLQSKIDQRATASAAFNVMYVSDMHLARNYPLVSQYADNFDVKLVVNTGDESEFGTRAEMTPAYVGQIAALTKKVPMIWLAGNHDSPATIDVMRSIPGVTVVGTKTANGDGYAVGAQALDVFGLTIAAVPDPRVYGAAGAYGADASAVVDPLERQAVDTAVAGIPSSARFDIFATHEPVAAEQLAADLPGQIRQTNSGHTHAQNADDQIQHDGRIDLVEGSTGAGGLDNLNRLGLKPPPIEFSIETVAVDCQFTKVVRFQIASNPQADGAVVPTAGQAVTARTVYLDPDQAANVRTCSVAYGVGAVRPAGGATTTS